jgi:RNA polymerase sigma-70 factor (ECF subfamily)
MLTTEPGSAPARADLADARLAAAGDTRAFERLYRAHVARIHGLARRMAGPDLAEELVQEIFVRAWQKLGTFRGESAFGTWLHRLAINAILSRRSVRARERDRIQEGDDLMERIPERPRGSEDRPTEAAISDALGRLRAACRSKTRDRAPAG